MKMNRNSYQVQQPLIEQPKRQGYSEKQFLWSWTAGALLPLGQAFIGGIVTMIATAGIIYAFDGIDYLKPMVLVGGAVFVVMWVILARRWMVLTAERLTGIDINQDSHIGPPPPARSVRVQIDNVEANGHIRQSQMFDFTGFADEEQLVAFAHGMLEENKTMAEREWAGPGKPFSIDQYRPFRSELIRRGLARAANSKSNNHGYELTLVGEKVMQKLIDGEDV